MDDIKRLTQRQLLAVIEDNNEAERDAMKDYYELWDAILKTEFDSPEAEKVAMDFIPQLKEIISDEMNHSENLSTLAIMLSGIEPAED